MKNIAILFISSLILFCSCSKNEINQKFTLEWLYSDEGKAIGALYRTEWIDNNLLYLMDMREPKDKRTILRLDPTLPDKIKPLINKEKVVNNLMSLINRNDTIMNLDWPNSFSSGGNYGL